MSQVDLKLDWATHEAAKYAVEHWHYSQRMPKNKLAKIGVWEGGTFIGCIIYGVGATANIAKPYGLKNTEVCELVRVALSSHKSPVSRIVKISLLMLKRTFSGLRIVVSYADSSQNHHGGIYQAGNWIYTGKISGDVEILIGGRWYHRRGAFDAIGTSSGIGRKTRPTGEKQDRRGKNINI